MKDLNDFNSLSEAIEYANSTLPPYPERPTKPRLTSNHTSKELEKYNSDFKDYETAEVKYKALREQYNLKKAGIDKLLTEHIKELSGLNNIPEQYQEKVWQFAWQEGHSNGYGEVYTYLCELVEIFD